MEFNPMAFVVNLPYMGGMLAIFVSSGILFGVTVLLNKITK